MSGGGPYEPDPQGPSTEDLYRKMDGIETRMHEIRLRLAAMEMQHLDHQGLQEKFNGQKLRIDRILGTTDDLLKRFEAWKSVGNEMGQDVIDLTGRVNVHGQMLEQLVEMGMALRDFMRAVQQTLGIEPATEIKLPGDDVPPPPVPS